MWSTEVLLTATSIDEGAFLDIGETGRFFQLRIRSTAASGLLVHVSPFLSSSPFFPYVDAEAGFVAPAFQTFKLTPPLTVKSYPLHRRT